MHQFSSQEQKIICLSDLWSWSPCWFDLTVVSCKRAFKCDGDSYKAPADKLKRFTVLHFRSDQHLNVLLLFSSAIDAGTVHEVKCGSKSQVSSSRPVSSCQIFDPELLYKRMEISVKCNLWKWLSSSSSNDFVQICQFFIPTNLIGGDDPN